MFSSAQPQTPCIAIRLIHIEGPLKGEIQEFEQAEVTIGRDPRSSVAFPPELKAISRKHAEIRRDGNRFKLIDQSRNGTFVQGKRVHEVYLKQGDVITFTENGPKVSFLSVVRETPSDRSVPGPSIRPLTPSPSGPIAITVQYGPTLKTYRQASLRFGSNPSCDLAIDLPGVAPHHLEFSCTHEYCLVKDLTGESRTLLNGRPLVQPTVLQVSDVVQLTPAGPSFVYAGDGKLLQRKPSAAPISPPQPPIVDHGPFPSYEPQESPLPPAGGCGVPRPGLIIPIWIWIALGSAGIVALIVYLVARWGGG